ncbi:MAG TPA: response regulator transcription factor [Anaerolineaceae bacterium]|nr:response regulator transcription factor [Anaerolineaceae bacterium]
MNQKISILVVDDEQVARQTLKAILETEGYAVRAVSSGEAALEELKRQAFDLMILDLRMTGIGGMEVLERSLNLHPGMRVIVLTAFASIESAIQAVRFHLSDYLMKPASPQEIVASVRKALSEKPEPGETHVHERSEGYQVVRRNQSPLDAFFIQPDIAIDFRKRRINTGKQMIQLTPTESRLLEVLLRYRNQVVQHSDLVFLVHGYRVETEEAAKILRPVMSRLRNKLTLIPHSDQWIQNVRSSGYMFELEE